MLEKIAEVQKKLSKRIVEKEVRMVSKIAAVDVSYKGNKARVALVICSFPDCKVLKTKVLETEVSFPYIPTFFFLRETRPILLVTKGEEFDVLIVEGHGKAHPRKYGLASHIGLILGKPTIGVAKKLLRGTPENSYRKVGKAYVSVGNMITLKDAVRIIEKLLDGGYPKPLKLADKLSKGKISEDENTLPSDKTS
ncbi:endonuclease V [Pyrococcus abyssi]|uniref:Endonuclease V n=1 Tax=Pyrococcus abyssi (strain GE5 / Orsay) TaxID=272844 RepID=NFI_PYRAB|nr:endonuclease V [Pyrococcus abyssi]Q9UYX5.1 RecName: Full=Endonuclease V; AltName: Full=Deoxyinosine 3'endonuclease; AltName: Full=Deoxyribonuclease V; Short=DNase V [Pyrococcus abyssi GE5]CAB50287.1 nfi endonuclease V [Pyrococcus abyssi GE5]CCE70825.1 TPA: endonuclease V [Pyrococcus abyssi GE5]